jgi:hypothetical protein
MELLQSLDYVKVLKEINNEEKKPGYPGSDRSFE